MSDSISFPQGHNANGSLTEWHRSSSISPSSHLTASVCTVRDLSLLLFPSCMASRIVIHAFRLISHHSVSLPDSPRVRESASLSSLDRVASYSGSRCRLAVDVGGQREEPSASDGSRERVASQDRRRWNRGEVRLDHQADDLALLHGSLIHSVKVLDNAVPPVLQSSS